MRLFARQSQSLSRTFKTYGPYRVSLTSVRPGLPSCSLLSNRVGASLLIAFSSLQSQDRNQFCGAVWPRPCVRSCWPMPPVLRSDAVRNRSERATRARSSLCLADQPCIRGSISFAIDITALTNTEHRRCLSPELFCLGVRPMPAAAAGWHGDTAWHRCPVADHGGGGHRTDAGAVFVIARSLHWLVLASRLMVLIS